MKYVEPLRFQSIRNKPHLAITYWAALPMARRRGLESRLHALLSVNARRDSRSGSSSIALVSAAALVSVSLSLVRVGGTPASAAGIRIGKLMPVVSSNRSPEAIPAREHARAGFRKGLPGGGTISLIAVGALQEGAKAGLENRVSWWQPDGSQCLLRLPQKIRGTGLANQVRVEGSRILQLVFEVTGLTDAQLRKTSPGFDFRFDGILANRMGAKVHIMTVTRQEPPGKRNATFDIGISSGLPVNESALVAVGEGIGFASQLGDDSRAQEFHQAPATAPRIYDATGYVGSNAPYTAPAFALLLDKRGAKDTRHSTLKFRLLDASGKVIDATPAGRVEGSKTLIEIFQMSREDARRIASYVVESQVTSFTRFSNVALAPKGFVQ